MVDNYNDGANTDRNDSHDDDDEDDDDDDDDDDAGGEAIQLTL